MLLEEVRRAAPGDVLDNVGVRPASVPRGPALTRARRDVKTKHWNVVFAELTVATQL